MSTQDALPHWLRTWFIAVSDAPLTNFKSINGEVLTYATFIGLALAEVFQLALREWLVYAWLGFLAGKVGFAMGGAWAKRATFQPSPPATQDIEDIAATTATPSPPKPPPKPEAVTALESAAAVEEGDPHQPIGEKVPGQGD